MPAIPTVARATLTDLVPRRVRRSWADQGYYADLDLFHLFERQAERLPAETAVLDGQGAVSFAELHTMALRIAGGLGERGVRTGDIVAVQLPNGRLSCAVDLAVAALGAIMLPHPLGRGGREVAALLAGAQATCAVVPGVHRGHDYARYALRLKRELPMLRTVVSAQPAEGCESIQSLLAAEPAVPSCPDPDSAARIMVSSGTEAEPKMVAFSHNALATGLGAVVGEVLTPGQRPRSLWLVPLATAFGSNAIIGTMIMHGGTLVLQSRFSPGGSLELVRRHQPSHLFAVPTMLRMMLDHPHVRGVGDAGLHAVVTGGARLDPGTAAAARRLFGCPVINTYGSSDGVHCILSMQADPGSGIQPPAGRPNPAVVEFRIVDDRLRDLPAGQVGEIIARGPFTPLCYLSSPGLNARYRTRGGWVRTGDLGTLGADGRLSVLDRRKEIVVRGGAKISPAEVEQLIQQLHAEIGDAACVGVPDPVMGERLCACVVPRDGRMTLQRIVAYLRAQQLEARKLPEHLVIMDSLPYGPAGKVDRRSLKKLAARALGLEG